MLTRRGESIKQSYKAVNRPKASMVKNRLNILGVGVDRIRFDEALRRIEDMIRIGTPHHVATVNPEFILRARRDHQFRQVLNKADLCTPDGFGIRLAASYLQKNVTWIPIVREVQIFLQGLWTGWLSIVNRRLLAEIPELVTGTDLVLALARLAEKKGYSIYFIDRKGGLAPNTAQQAAKRLTQLFPKVIIAGAETVHPDDESFVRRIQKAKPDLLFVAFGFPKQEFFIAENKEKLGTKVAIGVGGALDYIAGVRPRPPAILQGKFEWLWRLIIPSGRSVSEYLKRVRRIFSAAFVFPWHVFLWKLRWGAGAGWVKALALDFGGVTNQNGVDTLMRKAWQIAPLWQFPVLAIFYFRFIPFLEKGEIREEVVWEKFARNFGSRKDLDALRSRMINGFTANEPLWQLVREIKKDNRLKLALLTNNVKEWMEVWEERFKLSDYFDPIIASCYTGVRKPNPKIFRRLIKTLDVPPEQIVYVDDHRRHVVQARRLGMRAIHCADPAACAQTLREIIPA